MSNKCLNDNPLVLLPPSFDLKEENDNNNQYFNSINSTLKTTPSIPKSPHNDNNDYCPLCSDPGKSSYRNTTFFELAQITKFKHIGQDLNGSKVFEINQQKFNDKEREIYYKNIMLEKSKRNSSTMLPNSDKMIVIDRGGIVDLNFRSLTEKSKSDYESLYNDLYEYDLLNDNKLSMIKNVMKILDGYSLKLALWKLRMYNKKKKLKKGKCKALLTKYQSSLAGKGEILRFRKRYVRHSMLTKHYAGRCIEMVIMIQNHWRNWKNEQKRKSIMKTMIDKLPVLRLSLHSSIKRTKTEGVTKLKTNKQRLKVKRIKTLDHNNDNNDIVELEEDQPSPIKLLILPSHTIVKVIKRENNIIDSKAQLIQKTWKSSIKRKNQSCGNKGDRNILLIPNTISLPVCFITKTAKSKKLMIKIKQFKTKLLNHLSSLYKIFYLKHSKVLLQNIKNQVSTNKKNECQSISKGYFADIIFRMKFTYSIGKIISKNVQEFIFYYLRNYNKQQGNNQNFRLSYLSKYSFYFSTLRNHIALVSDFLNNNRKNNAHPLSFIASTLSHYLPNYQSLDLYSLYWNNPIQEKTNEEDLSNDIFKLSDKNQLISYMLLYLSAYEQKNISSNPNLLRLFISHIHHQSHKYTTSIFGISRFIQRFLHMIIVEQVPYCPKCFLIFYDKSPLQKKAKNIVLGYATFPNQNYHNCHTRNNMKELPNNTMKRANSFSNLFYTTGTKQHREYNPRKRNIMKTNISQTISKDNDDYRKMLLERTLSDKRFYEMAKETNFKWKN